MRILLKHGERLPSIRHVGLQLQALRRGLPGQVGRSEQAQHSGAVVMGLGPTCLQFSGAPVTGLGISGAAQALLDLGQAVPTFSLISLRAQGLTQPLRSGQPLTARQTRSDPTNSRRALAERRGSHRMASGFRHSHAPLLALLKQSGKPNIIPDCSSRKKPTLQQAGWAELPFKPGPGGPCNLERLVVTHPEEAIDW